MSYKSDINPNIVTVDFDTAIQFLREIGVIKKNILPSETTNGWDNNIYTTIKGDKYTLHNTNWTLMGFDRDYSNYNVYDLISLAKTAGKTNTEISDALNASKIRSRESLAIDSGNSIKTAGPKWTATSVKNANIDGTPGARQLQDYLDKTYSSLDPYVSVISRPDGNGYITRITYKNPETGERIYTEVPAPKNKQGGYSKTELSDIITSPTSQLGNTLNTIASQKEERQNKIANAESNVSLANTVLNALSGNVGSNANANRNLTSDDIDALTASLPSTSNLKAWLQTNKSDIVKGVSDSIKTENSSSDLIQRAPLNVLEELAGIVNENNTDTSQRNIDLQRQQLLAEIKNDPALYESIVQQFRQDNANNVTAGQRAANAGSLAREADTNYDSSAEELYNALFSQDGSIANARNNSYQNQTGAANAYIQGQLNNESKKAYDAAIQASDLETAIEALSTALGVDLTNYQNTIAENNAKADNEATRRAQKASSDVTTQIANNDAALQQIANMFGVGSDYLSSAANGNADVSAALSVITNALANPQATAAGYREVTAPAYQKASQFTNEQYNDVVNNATYLNYLNPEVIKSLTQGDSLDTILKNAGLDFLNEEGMRALYQGYADEANKQSDKLFTAAQRAYIAAIAAGDTKTTEQLTRLANTVGGQKGNLYATEAYANQLRQLLDNATTGLKLATDAQNQQASNDSFVAQAALDANKALTSFIGNGADTYGQGTVYGIANLWDEARAKNRNTYGKLSNKIMDTTSQMNTGNVQNNINNYDRLTQLASAYTGANATAAANNAGNNATRNSLNTQAKALLAQAGSTLENLKKLK